MPNPALPTGPPTRAEIAFLLLLQLITEDRMAAGDDADGSATCGRAAAILATWRRVGGAARVVGTPFDPASAADLKALRRLIDRAEPVMSRIARPLLTPRRRPAR